MTRDFGLDVDFMKRYHVCELYSYGHDKFAEEVILDNDDDFLI